MTMPRGARRAVQEFWQPPGCNERKGRTQVRGDASASNEQNRTVPRPEKNRVVAGGKPVRIGTRKVAPNIATTCCAPMPMVIGQARRSLGATTEPGFTVRPSPWIDQSKPRSLEMLKGSPEVNMVVYKIPHYSTRIGVGHS